MNRPVLPQDCVVFDDTDTGPRIVTTELFQALFNNKDDVTAGTRAVQAFTKYKGTLVSENPNSLGSRFARWQANNAFKQIAKFPIKEVLDFELEVLLAHQTELFST